VKKRKVKGWVYFIACNALDAIKIGWSVYPPERFRGIAGAFPLPLVLYTGREGTLEDERALHKRFAANRLNGEWFQATEELEELVAETSWAEGYKPWERVGNVFPPTPHEHC
jgi:hypothetical protein